MYTYAFNPAWGSGQNINATTTSTTVDIPTGTEQVRVINTGPSSVYLRISGTGVAATTADLLVLPNAIEVFTRFQDYGKLSAVCASGTAAVNVITGKGM